LSVSTCPGVDAEALEVIRGLAQEVDRRNCFFVRIPCGEGHSRVIIDGDIEELPACAAGFVLRIASDAMAGLDDAGQLFDVEVKQVARSCMFVAHDGSGRLDHPDLVQLQPSQDPADRGSAKTCGLCDPHAGPTLPAQVLHSRYQFRRGAARRPLRT
jgi:hypothetical protein